MSELAAHLVAGTSRGFAFLGVTCEKIYLDFSKPVALFPRIAGPTGYSAV